MHRHHLHYGQALNRGAAGVSGSIARPSTPVHSHMVGHDLHDLAMVVECCPQAYQCWPGLTDRQRAEDLPLLLSQAHPCTQRAGGGAGQAKLVTQQEEGEW